MVEVVVIITLTHRHTIIKIIQSVVTRHAQITLEWTSGKNKTKQRYGRPGHRCVSTVDDTNLSGRLMIAFHHERGRRWRPSMKVLHQNRPCCSRSHPILLSRPGKKHTAVTSRDVRKKAHFTQCSGRQSHRYCWSTSKYACALTHLSQDDMLWPSAPGVCILAVRFPARASRANMPVKPEPPLVREGRCQNPRCLPTDGARAFLFDLSSTFEAGENCRTGVGKPSECPGDGGTEKS